MAEYFSDSRVLSRVINALNGVTLIITLLITNLLSPLLLQAGLAQALRNISRLARKSRRTNNRSFCFIMKLQGSGLMGNRKCHPKS